MEKRYKNVRNAYQNNLDMFLDAPLEFEKQAVGAAYPSRYFRWHVSGDILNQSYFEMMIYIARVCKYTQFLAFTKKYELVNTYLSGGGVIPENLKIVFSVWKVWIVRIHIIFQKLMCCIKMGQPLHLIILKCVVVIVITASVRVSDVGK